MPTTEGIIAKRNLPIIYVIDTSGSMDGQKIATVNRAMHECENVLKAKADEMADAQLVIGAVEFSSGAKWVTDAGLVSLEDFWWNDVNAGGLTDLGEALKVLEKKMTRSEYFKSETGYFLPVIIFMSDGAPTDSWQAALTKVNAENKWFARARKIAIAIGDDADTDVLTELVGSKEAVIQANDLDTLKKLIVQVSVSASMLAGQSRLQGDDASGQSILDDATTKIDDLKLTPATTNTTTTTSDDDEPIFDSDGLSGDDDEDFN